MIARHEQTPTGAAAALAHSIGAAIPVLTGTRVTLRAPTVADFDLFARVACTPRGTYIGGPMDRAEAWFDFANLSAGWLLHGHGGWTITRGDDAIGFVLIGLEPGDQEPELGFLLSDQAEGQGLAFEAAALARDYAARTLRLASLVSYIDPANSRSIALAKRLGAIRDRAAEARLADNVEVWRHPVGKGADYAN